MTEAEWLTTLDLQALCFAFPAPASERKGGLFAAACLDAVSCLLADAASRAGVAAVEQAADGELGPEALGAANRAAHAAWLAAPRAGARSAARAVEFATRGFWRTEVAEQVRKAARACRLEPNPATLQAQCRIFRDIFGNPFRPVAFDPSWRTSTVVSLAAGIYADRAFDRLPILADALQDVGCDNADVLDHCRGERPHVRGCWVVDLVLGKG
jgi:hypothetical protein